MLLGSMSHPTTRRAFRAKRPSPWPVPHATSSRRRPSQNPLAQLYLWNASAICPCVAGLPLCSVTAEKSTRCILLDYVPHSIDDVVDVAFAHPGAERKR